MKGGSRGTPGSRRRLGIRRLEWPATSTEALPELLAFLGRHLLPALVHASPHIRARAMTTKASEQNAAESQQSDGLPKGNLAPSEQRRCQPIPQMHHQFAANPDEDHYSQDRQRSYPNH